MVGRIWSALAPRLERMPEPGKGSSPPIGSVRAGRPGKRFLTTRILRFVRLDSRLTNQRTPWLSVPGSLAVRSLTEVKTPPICSRIDAIDDAFDDKRALLDARLATGSTGGWSGRRSSVRPSVHSHPLPPRSVPSSSILDMLPLCLRPSKRGNETATCMPHETADKRR